MIDSFISTRADFERITNHLINSFSTLCARYGRLYLKEEAQSVYDDCLMSFNEDRGAFGSLFYRALSNRFLKMSEGMSREIPLESYHDVECEDYNARELVESLLAGAPLSRVQREVISYKFFHFEEELSDEEVGKKFGCSHQNVNKTLRKAYSIIRQAA